MLTIETVESNLSQLLLYPNPSQDVVHITSVIPLDKIVVYDTQDRIVYSVTKEEDS